MSAGVFGALFAAVGALLVFGAVRRWAWLVDPPTWLWFCYTQSMFKAAFGSEGCRAVTINMGAIFVCVGLFMFVRAMF
jgi:hypothetical protein